VLVSVLMNVSHGHGAMPSRAASAEAIDRCSPEKCQGPHAGGNQRGPCQIVRTGKSALMSLSMERMTPMNLLYLWELRESTVNFSLPAALLKNNDRHGPS
jgi:hypothetical protein